MHTTRGIKLPISGISLKNEYDLQKNVFVTLGASSEV
jgi:hypothetical protein